MNLSEITLPDMSGGINTREPQYEIADNQSPDMLNLWFKDKALIKRPGQQMLITNLEGSVYEISDEYNGYCVIHAGGKFYRWDEAGAKIYKGEFDTSKKYPEFSSFGDYYMARAEGTAESTYYKKGDIAIAGAQTVTAKVSGQVTIAGKTSVIVTASEAEGSPFTFSVALAKNDTAAAAAGKIRSALSAEKALTELYTVGGLDAEIRLTQITPDVYDKTLGITILKGTSEGLTQVNASVTGSVWHNAITEIGKESGTDTVADEEGAFVLFGDKLYNIDGSEIWEIHGEGGTWNYTAVKPYEPVVMINCSPDLSDSTDYEAYNLLGGGFTVKYSGNAGGNICYYIATIIDASHFTITDMLGSTTPIAVTSTSQTGWQIRKKDGDWISGASVSNTTVSNVTTSTFSLNSHGFSLMDAVQFDPGTGELPGGLKAWNSDALTMYKLPIPDNGLTDNISITVFDDKSPDGSDLVSGTDFTFNKDTGEVDFSKGTDAYGAPGTDTDNVWITAHMADANDLNKKKIAGCKTALTFGGEAGGVAGGTRVFITANPDYPQSYWHSDIGLHDGAGMSYFPDTGEEFLDQTCGKITAMAKMGNELIVFKDSSIFAVKYSYDGKDVYFPVRECNGLIGCDIPGSVQLIDNRLVFANTRDGVNMLISTSNDLENLVKPLSANINSMLLAETGLKEACSCDEDRHYWLCVNGSVYLWDYGRTPYYNYSDYEEAQKRLAWYRWNGIKARTFCSGSSLYYGFEDGIAQFISARLDFGNFYESYFKSKAFDLGRPQDLKTFMYVYPSFAADGHVSVRVSVANENDDEYMTRDFKIESFDWNDFSWAAFTLGIHKYARTFTMRLSMKKASYIQIKVSGLEEISDSKEEVSHGVGLTGLRITYFDNGKIKE